jgi:PPOX class probable F420-dependent enzyme
MATIEGRAAELLRAKNFCHISTLREDGTILNVPVWVDTDGEHIVVNSAEGRDWPANLRREGHATCTVTNHEDPYEYLTATCDLAEDTHEGADDHIDAMAKKYLDKDTYPFRKEGEQRVIFRLAPRKLTHRGG